MQSEENKPAAGSGIMTTALGVTVIAAGLSGGIGIGKLISPRVESHAEAHDAHMDSTEADHADPGADEAAPLVTLTPTIELAKRGDPMPLSMATSDCLACHQVAFKVVGPAYQQVADKYKGQPDQVRKLARKVIQGGMGVWGEIPMAPHPQHTFEQAQEMVAWILGQTSEPLASEDETDSAGESQPSEG